MGEEERKGFTVTDKRWSSRLAAGEKGEEAKASSQAGRPVGQAPFEAGAEANRESGVGMQGAGPVDFSSFVLSLGTSALIQLGEVEDPISRKKEKNLPLAKQTIDVLGMLQEKTAGNLTPQEERLLADLLYDLRMRFVRASGG